jgi:hypothetical protein
VGSRDDIIIGQYFRAGRRGGGHGSINAKYGTDPGMLFYTAPICVSAWNKDPVSGVIGVQTRPH